MNTEKWPAVEFVAQAGKLVFVSDWFTIDQARINQFADVTCDHQFIHIDEARTKADTEFGGTIAHGFLVLSMLAAMVENCFPSMIEAKMSINYGFDKIRFLNPVPSGSRIRGHFKLFDCFERKPGQLQNRYEITVEIENTDKPALVAEWLGLAIMNGKN